ncbi:MAG: ribosome-associated translation inhibitor RaiA [Rikenellaceae bacterium]
MDVKIQSIKFDADAKLLAFVEAKMGKLERFADRATSSDVIMKLDKDHEKGNKVVTISLRIPGDELIAENRAKSFEEAVDLSIDALKKQLERVKDK